MKIALPTSNGVIDPHFGHCAEFTLYSVNEDKSIASEEKVVPPGGCGCKTNIIPELAKKGVTVMLAGNMGGGAVTMLKRFGMEVFRGLSGDPKSAVQAWLAGKIEDSGVGCGEADAHGCG